MMFSAAIEHRRKDRRWCDCADITVVGCAARNEKVRFRIIRAAGLDTLSSATGSRCTSDTCLLPRNVADSGLYLMLGKPADRHSIEVEATILSMLCFERETALVDSGTTSAFDDTFSAAFP